ncbi:MAG: hypothetical protein ACLPY3_11465 [Solirubrobacteraceae bacterium]
MSTTRSAQIETWISGVRVVRHYDRSGPGRDPVAGIVLAAILVGQGV